jgi:hypothetical protein
MTANIYKHSLSVFRKVEQHPFIVIYAKTSEFLELAR